MEQRIKIATINDPLAFHLDGDEIVLGAEHDPVFFGNMVFRSWWKLDGKEEVMVGFEGNKNIPLVHIKTRKLDTGLRYSHTAVLDGALTLRQAHLLRDALIHVLKTMELDHHGDGCPTFLQPSE